MCLSELNIFIPASFRMPIERPSLTIVKKVHRDFDSTCKSSSLVLHPGLPLAFVLRLLALKAVRHVFASAAKTAEGAGVEAATGGVTDIRRRRAR